MVDLLPELWRYIKARKRFWLLPILVILLMLGCIMILTEGSVLAPFIYTLF